MRRTRCQISAKAPFAPVLKITLCNQKLIAVILAFVAFKDHRPVYKAWTRLEHFSRTYLAVITIFDVRSLLFLSYGSVQRYVQWILCWRRPQDQLRNDCVEKASPIL